MRRKLKTCNFLCFWLLFLFSCSLNRGYFLYSTQTSERARELLFNCFFIWHTGIKVINFLYFPNKKIILCAEKILPLFHTNIANENMCVCVHISLFTNFRVFWQTLATNDAHKNLHLCVACLLPPFDEIHVIADFLMNFHVIKFVMPLFFIRLSLSLTLTLTFYLAFSFCPFLWPDKNLTREKILSFTSLTALP